MNLKILMVCLMIKTVTSDWVDPHEMNTNAKQKYMKQSPEKSSSVPGDICNSKDIQVYQSYLKRLISVLINSAHIHNDDNAIEGHIRFNIDPDHWQFLINFPKNDITLDSLRKLERVYSETFKKSYLYDYMDRFEFYQMKLYSLIVNVRNLLILGSLFVLYTVYQLVKNGFSLAYIMKYLLFFIVIWDFSIRYQTLIKEVEEHNSHVQYSNKCDTNKMSWTNYLKFLLSSGDCEMRSVTPLDVFLVQIKQLIIIPMRAFGTGMGSFGREMFTTLPWGANLVLWPVMLVFVLILLIFLMAFITNVNVDFNILHLVKLRFGGSKTHHESYLTGPTIDRLMSGLIERSVIQEVSTSERIQTRDREKSKKTSPGENNNKSTKSMKPADEQTFQQVVVQEDEVATTPVEGDNNIETLNSTATKSDDN